MKIKMYQVFKVLNIYKNVKELTVPAKVAYNFNKLCVSLDADAKFYEDQVSKILQQYGEKNEDGSLNADTSGVKIKEEFIETAQKEMSDLWNLEVDAPDIYFTIDELDGLNLSIEDFNGMLPFIKED